jgi:hypothetical protein
MKFLALNAPFGMASAPLREDVVRLRRAGDNSGAR